MTDQMHHICRVGINVRVNIKDNSKNGDRAQTEKGDYKMHGKDYMA